MGEEAARPYTQELEGVRRNLIQVSFVVRFLRFDGD